MTKKIPYIDKMALIHGELLKLAKASPLRTIRYGDFGGPFGIPAQGPWKVLDRIAEEQVANKLPDITYLVVNRTGYPSKIGGRKAKQPPTANDKALAKTEGQRIITKYNPGAANPF